MSNDSGSNYYTMSSAARDFYSQPMAVINHSSPLLGESS